MTTVSFHDFRPASAKVRVVGMNLTEAEAHECAANVARGAARAIGVGCAVTEQPRSIFELWHNGEHIADVVCR